MYGDCFAQLYLEFSFQPILHPFSKSAEILLTEEHNYNQAPLHLNDIAPVVHPYWWTVSYPPVTRDIACFPISTFNFSPDVKSAVTEVVDVLDRKASLVST